MLIRGHRVENEEEELVVFITADASRIPNTVVTVFILIPTIVLMTIAYFIITALKKKSISNDKILDDIKESNKTKKKRRRTIDYY